MGISGVYCITIGDNFYIGSTINYNKRIRGHYNELKRNTHRNAHLQNAFNKHGYIEAELIEQCDTSRIHIKEQEYLDQWFGDDRCMNFMKVAVVNFGHKFGQDARKKMSEAAKRRDPKTRDYGPKSDECKRKIGEANGKLGWEGAAEVRRLRAEGMSQPAIAKLFGLDQSTISDVLTGKSWKVGQ